MTATEEFPNWLKTENNQLPAWDKFKGFLSDHYIYLKLEWTIWKGKTIPKLMWEWQEEDGDFKKYIQAIIDFNYHINFNLEEESYKFALPDLSSLFASYDALTKKRQEFIQLKNEKSDLESQLQTHQATITNNRQRLDQANSELTKNQQNVEELTKKVKELSQNQLSSAEIAILSRINEFTNEEDSEEENKQSKEGEKIENIKVFLRELQKLNMAGLNEHIRGIVYSYNDALEIIIAIFKMYSSTEKKLKETADQLENKEKELKTLQQQSTISTAPLRQEITDLKKQLQESQDNYQKSNEKLHQSQQERDQLTAQIQELVNKNQEFENQLTALALSSGLLTQQCEDLSKKLTESERKELQTKLEADIKANLLVQKEQELKNKDTAITEQEEKIKNYQNILRQAEENLSKCQKIITAKDEQLTKLEAEKDQLEEELEQAQEKIKELEENFLTSQTKIMELETRIKELEKDNSKDSEIVRLKQQLASEKQKSQQFSHEVKKIKEKLEEIKTREEQLAANINKLETEKITLEETIAKNPPFNWKKWGIIGLVIFLGGIFLYWVYKRMYGKN